MVGFFVQKNRERIGKVTEVNKAKEYLLQVSRAEHRIKRLQEEIQTLQELVRKLVEIRAEIMTTISKLNNTDHREILYKRYCQSKTWEVIACELDYSYRWILKLHGRALLEIEKFLKCS